MLLIRADGNARIGVGHLMRCLTIAEELAARQGGREDICFVCADGESAGLAEERGFGSRILGTDYRDMESELGLWRDMAAGSCNVILVDSYYVTDRYLTALRQYGQLVLMDDMGTRPYPVDCVINYNAPASPAAYRKLYPKGEVRLLIGSRYVPLRRQFLEAAPAPKVDVENVLLTTGGGDVENIAGAILEKIYREDLAFHLVIGRFNPHFQRMKERERRCANLFVHHDVADMAGLMRGCDVALTAGGSTVYELAAVGIPFLCFSYAENQEPLTEYIGRNRVAGFAGAWHRDSAKTLEETGRLFEELIHDREKRMLYRNRELELVDGHGAERIARELAALPLQGAENGKGSSGWTEGGTDR